ncbi:amino acid ABC transporter permease [Alloscardovia venturai]|uniref:Amino acid ABC transporter permease n=1 Tax=Alloscardovia venturai TaxID=1769421 RepID=A0ABW2Y9Z3_9BIFI
MAPHIPNRIKALPVRKPGPVVAGIIVALLAAWLAWGIATNENFAWPTVWKYLFNEHILTGVGWTLWLTFISMIIAIVLAVALAIMRKSDNVVLRAVSWFFIWFFRGTPVYTQLTFWGLISVLIPKIGVGSWSLSTADVITAGRAAVIGLSLNEAAYLAEIVRAGLEAVDRGQTEAAQALGMKRSLIMRRVILPQAMRIIIPPTGNEAIGLLKTTSLVLAVPFTMELQYMSNNIANRIYQPIPLLLVAGIWYLVITSILMVGQSYLEKYFGKGFDVQPAGARGKNPPLPGKTDGEPKNDVAKENEAFWGGLNA